MTSPLCAMLGVSVPILQAPIGSASCPALAAAVSNAGGLGALAMSWRSLDETRSVLKLTQALTTKPFAVNFVLAFPPEERLAVCLDAGVPIFSFAWGAPEAAIRAVRAAGRRVLVTVASGEQARAMLALGADALIAQGFEAGGHVMSELTTMTLVPEIVDALPRGVPVLAAGGIADGRGIAAALMLGAGGVSLGTRFLASAEANAHPVYKRRVVEARGADTIYGEPYRDGWPDAPHRVLRNRTTAAWEMAGRPLSSRSGEGDDVIPGVPRYSDVIPLPRHEGDVAELAMYAGQSVGLVAKVEPAAAIVAALVRETAAALQRPWP